MLQHPNIEPSKALGSTQATALTLACYHEWDLEIFKLILAHEKTDINVICLGDDGNPCASPFSMAISRRQFDRADLIINHKNFNVSNVLLSGITELHDVMSASYPNEKLRFDHVKKLIAAGANPNIRRDCRRFHFNDNSTPIEEARDYGYTEIASYLEAARLDQLNSRYNNLRTQYSNNNIDRTWQENSKRIHDSGQEAAEYLRSLGSTITV